MGASAQFLISWTPEDDLMLKNAVEGGASLESLAKGAVQFSRRFNIKEIRERWVSILYDPVVSAEVSARLMEIKHNSFNPLQKSLKPGGLKANKCDAKKIKTQSIRNHYYAARKRIHNENLRSMEMELAGRHFYASDDNNGMEPRFNTMIGDPTLKQPERLQSNAGLIDHSLSQVKIDGLEISTTGITTRSFHAPHVQFNHESSLGDQGSLPKENSPNYEKVFLSVDCLHAEKAGIPEHANICDANGMAEDQHLITDFDNLFDDCDDFLPDDVSLESLDFPSTLLDMSWWEINSGSADPIIPVNDDPASQSQNAGEILVRQEGGRALDAFMPNNDAGPANSLNQDEGPTDSGSDEYLAMIYGFLDDEIPVMDTDDKPPDDNPLYEGLRSLLLTSPIVADGYQTDVIASKPSDLPQSTANTASVLGASHAGKSQAFPPAVLQMSTFLVPPQSPAQIDFASCILNTEDPLIPNNDDIILDHTSSSVKDLLECHNNCVAASNLPRRDHDNLGKWELHFESQIGQLALEKSFDHTHVNCKAPNNLPEAGTLNSLRSTSLSTDLPKRGHSELVISRGSDRFMNNEACPSETNELCNKSDIQPGETPDDQALNQRVDCDDSSMRESLAQHSLSKFEVHAYESDDEIPYYSDVEEMVLEMDLDPVEQDIEIKEKVSKYQCRDGRKAIMRLEQAALSFVQRAIARRGALAIIYGRNSKHFISKSEVLLGRGTDDSQVDIDLAAEGRAHKVSRRQAVVRLEDDGNFYIKNIGKRSVYKNNLELATGKTTRLQSGSLIEIQGLTFIFEDNPIFMRRHLRNLQKPAKPVTACLKPPD